MMSRQQDLQKIKKRRLRIMYIELGAVVDLDDALLH